ncbi:MAG: FkbM family methyltransferase [Anaeromyxobacteraceae bacterium]
MLYRGDWKGDAFRRLAQAIPFKSVVDVGANEGHTILELQRAGLGALPVHVFEPTPACAFYLTRLIAANEWKQVQLFPFALAGIAGAVPLELESENSSGASIIPDLRPGRRMALRLKVAALPLDQLVQQNLVSLERGLALMKIDVEGAELDVLAGARETLSTKRPIILCEVLWADGPTRLEFMRSRNRALMELLHQAGYEVHQLILSKAQDRVLGLRALTDFPSGTYGPNNAHECDYIFLPREVASSVIPHLSG